VIPTTIVLAVLFCAVYVVYLACVIVAAARSATDSGINSATEAATEAAIDSATASATAFATVAAARENQPQHTVRRNRIDTTA
jgi:Na+-transporting methylmalonyl-CoA/oxaloacetate decarboxylase gamma subunit